MIDRVDDLESTTGDSRRDPRFPTYQGAEFVRAALPKRFEPWPLDPESLAIDPGFHMDEATSAQIQDYCADKPWVWPKRKIVLLTDLHADAEAFVDSLVASGTVARTGPGPLEFEQRDEAEGVLYIISGDCFDKGPSNLELLRSLRRFLDLGADVKLLAGNHDVRALVGMLAAGRKEPDIAHFFIRMGQKAVPLFNELIEAYGIARPPLGGDGEDAVRERLFPSASWFDTYRKIASGIVPPAKIDLELVRIQQKSRLFVDACHAAGISLECLDEIVEVFRREFLSAGGDYAWFFSSLDVAHREGSLLFIHAGVDDEAVELITSGGVDGLNAAYSRMVRERDLFKLYHGPIGNCFRTKYRDTDLPLTSQGTRSLLNQGIYLIVHGHRNLTAGQRLMFRQGILNIECDCGVDRNTRIVEGLKGHAAAATVIHPDGSVVGISSDRPGAKLIEFKGYSQLLTVV